MTNAKFDFFERVKILCQDEKFKYLNNTDGTVLAKGTNSDKSWGYSVSCDANEGYILDFQENELQSLGTFAKREDYYSGDRITVGVTKDGKGYIKEYNSASRNQRSD